MNLIVRCGAAMALAGWLAGCSTIQGDFHQKLQIDALDARDRPVEGLPCHIGSGDSAVNFVTPGRDVRVRRSEHPLAIECGRGNQVATATVKPQRERMEEALLPFGVGTAGVFIDHLSGSLYGYPTTLRLRVGQHLVLEHGGARVASSEPIAPPADAKKAAAQRIETAATQPAPITSVASAGPAAASQKTRAAAPPKAERAAPKPVKIASAAPLTPKPLAPATATVAPVRSAPTNW
jgi:hypothetical protein